MIVKILRTGYKRGSQFFKFWVGKKGGDKSLTHCVRNKEKLNLGFCNNDFLPFLPPRLGQRCPFLISNMTLGDSFFVLENFCRIKSFTLSQLQCKICFDFK